MTKLKLGDVLNTIKIQNVDIVGSYKNKKIKYPFDIDVHSNAKFKGRSDLEKIHKKFIRIVSDVLTNPFLRFSDFKLGVDNANKGIKWTPEDIKQGYKIIDGKQIKFIDALIQSSVIKLDIIAVIGNRFVDITNNYYFDIGPISTDPSKRFVESVDAYEKSFFSEYKMLMEKGNYFKALKRLYTYSNVRGYKELSNKLLELFNSDIGREAKNINDIEIIKKYLENKYEAPNMVRVNNALSHIENLPKYIFRGSDKTLVKRLYSAISTMSKRLNNKLLRWINTNKNILL
jgi:hypothetical protein